MTEQERERLRSEAKRAFEKVEEARQAVSRLVVVLEDLLGGLAPRILTYVADARRELEEDKVLRRMRGEGRQH